MKKIIIAALVTLSFTGAEARIRPGSLIGDNMVLQQLTEARLNGKATPGATVTVTPPGIKPHILSRLQKMDPGKSPFRLQREVSLLTLSRSLTENPLFLTMY